MKKNPNHPFERIRSLMSVTALIYLSMVVVIASCKPHSGGGQAEAYIENGKIWAYGSVQLADLGLPGSIKLERVNSDQNIDNRQTGYKLFGEIEARTGGRGKRTISYVDYHPTNKKVLAYHYQLDFSLKNNNTNEVYVYAFLRKAGLSYHKRQRVYLGLAKFNNNQSVTKLQLNSGLQVSMIGDGVNSGQWALHYPKIKMITLTPYNGRCPKFVGQMPGQNPSQNPAQFRGCRPIPAQVDLCESNPTKAACQPQFPMPTPSVQPGQPAPAPTNTRTSGLVVVAGKDKVFTMDSGDREAKVIFIANKTNATQADNNELCRSSFLAIAKTVGGQLNDSCTLKPAPAEVVDGKMTCAITVKFDDAQTYLDKICNITAVFRGQVQENQTIQILKK